LRNVWAVAAMMVKTTHSQSGAVITVSSGSRRKSDGDQ
jgi:hypothetical protein